MGLSESKQPPMSVGLHIPYEEAAELPSKQSPTVIKTYEYEYEEVEEYYEEQVIVT